MLLHGNARGGSKNLADHMMSPENEFVTIVEISGWSADNLHDAFAESYAVSKGTQCKKFLYSLSLNPPPDAEVKTEDFVSAVDRVEAALGLSGQPRAIILHEKSGADGITRRHAHAVFARVNTDTMKAVPLSWDRMKLRRESRRLFMENEWKIPQGLINSKERSMKNFDYAQWQQAKRQGKDIRQIKDAFTDAWLISDSKAAFEQALASRGYRLARGDRRGFVGVDELGEVYSVPRMAGIKTKQVRERLGPEEDLPNVEQVKGLIAKDMLPILKKYEAQLDQDKQQRIAAIKAQKAALIEQQRTERQNFKQKLAARAQKEALQRQAKFRRGVKGIWDRFTGSHAKIKAGNTADADLSMRRDRAQMDALVFKQMAQRRRFSGHVQEQKQHYVEQRQALKQDVQTYRAMKAPVNPTQDAQQAFMDKRRMQAQSPPQQKRCLKPRQ